MNSLNRDGKKKPGEIVLSILKKYVDTWQWSLDEDGNSNLPLILAEIDDALLVSQELKDLRRQAHNLLDGWWKGKYGTKERSEVYALLKKKFGKTVHISECNEDMCRKVINYLNTL